MGVEAVHGREGEKGSFIWPGSLGCDGLKGGSLDPLNSGEGLLPDLPILEGMEGGVVSIIH